MINPNKKYDVLTFTFESNINPQLKETEFRKTIRQECGKVFKRYGIQTKTRIGVSASRLSNALKTASPENKEKVLRLLGITSTE